jgi:hypothetical protein
MQLSRFRSVHAENTIWFWDKNSFTFWAFYLVLRHSPHYSSLFEFTAIAEETCLVPLDPCIILLHVDYV